LKKVDKIDRRLYCLSTMLKKILFELFRYIAHFNKQNVYIGTKKTSKSFNIGHFGLLGAKVGLASSGGNVS